jgi:hypothetical protein
LVELLEEGVTILWRIAIASLARIITRWSTPIIASSRLFAGKDLSLLFYRQ